MYAFLDNDGLSCKSMISEVRCQLAKSFCTSLIRESLFEDPRESSHRHSLLSDRDPQKNEWKRFVAVFKTDSPAHFHKLAYLLHCGKQY